MIHKHLKIVQAPKLGLWCLNDHIRTHLSKKASEKHHINITSDRILMSPFFELDCRDEVFDPIIEAKVHLLGIVKTFKSSPLVFKISMQRIVRAYNV